MTITVVNGSNAKPAVKFALEFQAKYFDELKNYKKIR